MGPESPVKLSSATKRQSNRKLLEVFKQGNDMAQCILFRTSLWLLGGEYIVKNQNEVLTPAATGMNLKNIMRRERSHT